MDRKASHTVDVPPAAPQRPLEPDPLVLGIFHRQIEGDHHLLELAQRRFDEAGLGAELHPESVAEVVAALEFRPQRERRYTMHLPRHVDLVADEGRRLVAAFANRGRTDAYGIVVHDQKEAATRPDDYVRAAGLVEGRRDGSGGG